jgi:hypothetical protein
VAFSVIGGNTPLSSTRLKKPIVKRMVAFNFQDFHSTNSSSVVPFETTFQHVMAGVVALQCLFGFCLDCLVMTAMLKQKKYISSSSSMLIQFYIILCELVLNLVWFITNGVNCVAGGWLLGGGWMMLVYVVGGIFCPGVLQLSIFLTLERYYTVVVGRQISIKFFRQQIPGLFVGGILITLIPFYLGKWQIMIEMSSGMMHAGKRYLIYL